MNTETKTEGGIAIVGMAGRFPKAKNIGEFWRNLCEGAEAVSFFTGEEMAAAGAQEPTDRPNYVKARAILEEADLFDAAFFGLTPREAEILDPQHRLFLECAAEALENAGCDPGKYPGAIGVFAGMSMNTYAAHNILTRPDLRAQVTDHQIMFANDKDFLPTRVSYKLNLRGPSLNIQTACSTSLVAVCVACQNLMNYECDAALAGAASVTFPQKRGYLYQEGGIASPDGHCRPFDAKAEGTILGEGVGIVLLKRVEDAMADGDTIYAVIKGFAINNDGANKISYAAPSIDGQAEVIATAQSMAGFNPDTITYVEAHGTATPLGDPIEIEGLTRAFQAQSRAKNFCAIGSVKSNIGHLDTAAGIAGLIKTALALHHHKIPPSLHFESPNPKIDFANSPFYVNAKLADWKNGKHPRRAGVSSFGIGGTNAHVVLEEAPATVPSSQTRPAQLLLLSTKTDAALAGAAMNLGAHLRQHPAINLADVAHTLQVGRQDFARRRMLVCRSTSDAMKALEDIKASLKSTTAQENPRVVFMFPGQGAQHAGMARELYEAEPVFREEVDACCERIAPHLGFDLRTALYPAPDKIEGAEKRLKQTAVTQPALFVIEYALAKLWMSWGVQPEAMIGHSVGEYVAACLAGVYSLPDALKLIAARGRMMQEMPGGTMLAVRLPEQELKPFLNDKISLAVINSPSVCVLAGPADAMDALGRELLQRQVATTPLLTSHAFHSSMMDPIVQPFAEMIGKVAMNPAQIPFISNVTGTWMDPKRAMDSAYWAKQLRQPVRFAEGIAELCKDSSRVFLEVGPGQTLSNLVRQHPARNAKAAAIASLRHAKETTSDWDSMLNAVGQLWLTGVKMDWSAFYENEKRQRIPLPTYPFERKRFWIEPGHSNRPDDIAAGQFDADGPTETATRRTSATAATPSIASDMRQLLGELSGLDLAEAEGDVSFSALGFDSLFLTQASVMIEKRTGVNVTFRQLLGELNTLNALEARVANGLKENAEKNAAAKGNESSPSIFREPTAIQTIPLTAAQRELWFASQMSDEASCAYNESQLLHLRGPVKQEWLLGSLIAVTRRHEAMRTTFSTDGESQHVHPVLPLKIPIVDWSDLQEEERQSRLDRIQEEEAGKPFDLVHGPLIRATLIRLQESHYALAVTVHHIVCDGHSLGVLLRELAETYSADYRRLVTQLPEPMQLSQFVRRPSRESAAAADEKFWQEEFANGAPVLELPTDKPRPPVWTFEGAMESRAMPATLTRQLKTVSAKHGGTLFTTLLSAYAVLLHKLSGQDEIVVGVPIADRATAGGETLVAHCVNFLPLPVKIKNETFAEFRAAVQQKFLDIYDHQSLAFGRLVQALNLPRDPGRMPLVLATINVQRLGSSLKFQGLESALKSNAHACTNFDLGFNITETDDSLDLNCRYNASVYSGETVQRWLGHFQTLLESFAAHPEQAISSTSLLSTEERKHILSLANRHPAEFPAPKCIHQLVEEQVTKTPEAIAVRYGNEQLSYVELNRRANQLAHRLRSLGVGPEVLVGLCMERSLEMVVSILAVLKAGGAYLPMDAAYPAERLTFVLEDAKAPVLITQRTLAEKFQAHQGEVICVDEFFASDDIGHDENPTAAVGPENLAYVIYTSGSTGKPKGVQVTHHNVTRLFHATQPWYQFNASDVWTLFHSHAFDFSVWEIWGALIYGGRLVVVPHLVSRSPETFLELLVREKVTVLNQTPSAFRQLIQAEQRAASAPELALRYVIFGGEALEMRSLKPWFDRHGDQKPQLVNMYGITETTVHVTYRPITAQDLDSGSVIGEPIPDLQIYLLDGALQPVPIGLPGEIFVGGQGVARGYLNRPELTAARFIANPFTGEAGGRLYKAGDLARWLANGDIEYLGRADDQVKIRGHRIELGEIESTLVQHPAVRECVTLVRMDTPGDQRLTAYLVTEPDKASLTSGELRAFVKTRLPDYMIPAAFVFLESLPLTSNGKVNKKALPAPELARPDLDESFAAPATPTEILIAEIWREVLRVDRIGVHDNFFELGGHSLLMMQVVSRLREAFEIELSIRSLFEAPTIAALSGAVEELLAEEIGRLSDEEVQQLDHSSS